MMKDTKTGRGAIAAALAVAVFLAGCLTPVPYSFVDDGGDTASMIFSYKVKFVSYDHLVRDASENAARTRREMRLPLPPEDGYWEPVLFPAGERLAIQVHVSHTETETTTTKDHGHPLLNLIGDVADALKTPPPSRDVERDVWFDCPPLVAGRSYGLRFRKGPHGRPGRNTLILRDMGSKRDVYEQDF